MQFESSFGQPPKLDAEEKCSAWVEWWKFGLGQQENGRENMQAAPNSGGPLEK